MKSLIQLFALLENNSPLALSNSQLPATYSQPDISFLKNYFSKDFDISALPASARELFEQSFNAFDSFLHGWMSELPIEAELVRYGKKILTAAQMVEDWEQKRSAAEKAASDRGDMDVIAVLKAAQKTQHEIHRMTGLLRFNPDERSCYIARCEPDHFILPALGEYFTSRFGDTAWQIIDEKRGLNLSRRPGEPLKFEKIEAVSAITAGDEWEELWRHYHKTVNNEQRNNPNLQRQFMPKRYWKHLPEKNFTRRHGGTEEE